jgi:hypothetical protein
MWLSGGLAPALKLLELGKRQNAPVRGQVFSLNFNAPERLMCEGAGSAKSKSLGKSPRSKAHQVSCLNAVILTRFKMLCHMAQLDLLGY